jgi:hypothetical protein
MAKNKNRKSTDIFLILKFGPIRAIMENLKMGRGFGKRKWSRHVEKSKC